MWSRRWPGGLLALWVLVAAPLPPPENAVAVIVHPDVPVEGLRLGELRQIMLGERQFWPDGTRIVVLVPAPGSPARAVMLMTVFRMNEAEYRRYWIGKVFRNEVVSAPKAVDGPLTAAGLVARIPGALALVAIPIQPAWDARVLPIDGRGPGAPGYQLYLP